jgi:Na+/phosphate symporter
MTEEQGKKAFRERLKALCPLVDYMRLMLAAARHAFNRHSRTQLEEMARLHKTFTLEIDPFFEQVEAGLKKTSATDKPYLLKLQKILTNLELMTDRIAGLAEPLRYKAKQGAILSDQDVFAVNNVFSQLGGLLRTLVDIFQINDPSLKAYVLQESQRLSGGAFRSETDHETRMMDTPGRPDAWSVYLAILEVSREMVGHLEDIIKSLD